MRFVSRLLLVLFFPVPLFAQLSSVGGETPRTFTPPIAPIEVNRAALAFAAPGINTYILTVQPTVSIRLYLTNETPNACLGTFSVSMAVTSLGGVQSFNNNLQSWQSVALISTTGQLVSTVGIDIPASGTVYVSSTAISGTQVAISVVNTIGACASTSIDVTAVLTQVSVTSPLISIGTNGINGGLTANVQGIIPTAQNGSPIFPVVVGALQPAINQGTFALGLDTSGNSTVAVASGQTAIFSISPPVTTQVNEFALAFIGPDGASGGSTIPALPSSWTCITSGNCIGFTSPPIASATLFANSTNRLGESFANSNAGTFGALFAVFTKAPSLVRNAAISNGNISVTLSVNSLAGSTLALGIGCNSTLSCIIAPSDTQGLIWRSLGTVAGVGSGSTGSVSVWIAGPTIAASDTITFNVVSGTITGNSIVELNGITPASLNQPSSPLLVDIAGNLKARVDAGNPFSCTITLSTNTTTQCQPVAPAGFRNYVQGYQFLTTAAGTTTTVGLSDGTGTNCGTGTVALTPVYPDTTTSPANSTGVTVTLGGSGLVPPAGAAICGVQAGTTPGTVVVTVNG